MTPSALRAKYEALVADFAHTQVYCQGQVVAESRANLIAFVEALIECSERLQYLIPDPVPYDAGCKCDDCKNTAALSRLEELTK